MNTSADIGFFTPLQLMGEDYGFPLFGTYHLIYLCFSALLAFSIMFAYRHLREGLGWDGPRRWMILVIPIVIISLKLSEIAIMISCDVYSVYYWPLHPCNLTPYIGLLFALTLRTRASRPLGEILYTIGLPGSIAGLLFSSWIRVSIPWNWFCLCGFVEHSLLVGYVLMLLYGHDFVPDIRRIWQPIAFCAVCAPLIYWFNSVNGTNFWFVNTPSAGSPLVLFAQWCGIPGYLVPYTVLCIGVWTLMYLPWRGRARLVREKERFARTATPARAATAQVDASARAATVTQGVGTASDPADGPAFEPASDPADGPAFEPVSDPADEPSSESMS